MPVDTVATHCGTSTTCGDTAGCAAWLQAVADVRPVNAYAGCQTAAASTRYVSWSELQTMLFLKIVLSDTLTILSARCRGWYVKNPMVYGMWGCGWGGVAVGVAVGLRLGLGWDWGLGSEPIVARAGHSSSALPCFRSGISRRPGRLMFCGDGKQPMIRFFERRPGYALALAVTAAVGVCTLLASYWPFPHDDVPTLSMAPLAHAKSSVALVWLLAVVSFLVQDAAKVVVYRLLAKASADRSRAVELRLAQGRLRAAIDSENRVERMRGKGRVYPMVVHALAL